MRSIVSLAVELASRLTVNVVVAPLPLFIVRFKTLFTPSVIVGGTEAPLLSTASGFKNTAFPVTPASVG